MPNTMPGTGSGDKAVAMKKYGDPALHMESVKQERSNLMSDNPVAKDASGGRGSSWMSKHARKVGGGSPLHTFEGGAHRGEMKHDKAGNHLGKK